MPEPTAGLLAESVARVRQAFMAFDLVNDVDVSSPKRIVTVKCRAGHRSELINNPDWEPTVEFADDSGWKVELV